MILMSLSIEGKPGIGWVWMMDISMFGGQCCVQYANRCVLGFVVYINFVELISGGNDRMIQPIFICVLQGYRVNQYILVCA